MVLVEELKTVKIHSIDLSREKCEVCGKSIYPAIFSSIVGNWNYKYTCKDCIVKSKHMSYSEIKEIERNYLENTKGIEYLDNSWLHNIDKAELLDRFIQMEEEDKLLMRHLDLWKAHTFKEELEKGNIMYSEEEMFDYFNFYHNNPEIVLTLRELLHENPKSRFLKSMYFFARTKKLTQEQLKTLKRNKKFSFIEADIKDFWECLPLLLNSIETGCFNEDEEEVKKIKSIIESVMNEGFFTEKQHYVIKEFMKKI